MDEHHSALVLSFNILRWLGLSFTTIHKSSNGDLIAVHSKLHFVINVLLAAAFTFLFFHLDITTYTFTERIYKSSMIVYPLYTKIMALTVILFSVCGNVYNRKFVEVMNGLRGVRRRLASGAGRWTVGRGGKGFGVLVAFGAYLGAITGVNVWVDMNLTLHFGRMFRLVHHVCFYYVSGLTLQLVVAMEYIRESFFGMNCALGTGRGKVRMRGWMEGFLELREAEGAVNEVLGKQIFLSLLLAFSSLIVNVYYMISLNLYETTNLWLNVTMFMGFFQSALVVVVSTMAAESAAGEANRVNEVTFEFLIDNQQMYNQMKYFTLFNYYYPMEFRVWVFYALNYDSLFKVMLTSSAVTTIILQCDFLRGTLS